MDIWNSLCGMIAVEVTGAEPEKTLDAVSAANIEIRNIKKQSELTYSFIILWREYGRLAHICNKHGDICKIRKTIGLRWVVKKIIFRPILVLGSAVFLFLALWLPTRVFFIRVEGNTRIPANRILDAAESCGVSFGASRREVRSEHMKNALLSAVPELQWAGINTSGCTAIISVREKKGSGENKKTGELTSILASRDGYVLSCTATAGNLLVKPGDTVRKGQVLISAYTDCGLCIRAEQAEGDVMAQTIRRLEAIMPETMLIKGQPKQIKRKYSLLLRKKRIFLWKDSGIWEGSCGRMYKEYYITLPGGFQLPMALCIETYPVFQCTPMDHSLEDARTALASFSQTYLLGNMIAGKIHDRMQTMAADNGRYLLTCEYVCEEMIGTVRQEQIGDTNGKIS